MAIKLEGLLAGVKLPPRQVYIEALDDAVEFLPITLERYKALSARATELHEKAQAVEDEAERAEALTAAIKEHGRLQLRVIAECLSQEEGIGFEEAEELCETVRDKTSPAIFNEISTAILESIMGAGALAGK